MIKTAPLLENVDHANDIQAINQWRQTVEMQLDQ